jgi:hypothetical protein
LSSTRSSSKKSISSSVAPCRSNVSAPRVPVFRVVRFALKLQVFNVRQTQPQIDHCNLATKGVAAGVGAKRAEKSKTRTRRDHSASTQGSSRNG